MSTMPCYSNTGVGDAFIESVNFGGNLAEAAQTVGMQLGPQHQNVWARALDIEGWSNHVFNQGSTLWVLGLKFGETEGKPYVTLLPFFSLLACFVSLAWLARNLSLSLSLLKTLLSYIFVFFFL